MYAIRSYYVPLVVQLAIVVDAGCDIPARLIQLQKVRVLLADFTVGCGHDLHQAAGTGLAGRARVQPGFGDALRFEPAPVDVGAEIALGVFAEMGT